MNKERKTILLNQLRIMSAMQRLEYFVHQQEIEDDLSEGIKDTQKILDNDIDNKISMQQESTSLKQALNKIRKCCESDCIEVHTREYGNLMVCDIYDILQIISEAIGDDDSE